MKIQVTADDIRQGVPGGCETEDPIYLALKRMGVPAIKVLEMRIVTYDGWTFMPVEAEVFVRRFHTGWPVEPFEFDFEVTNPHRPGSAYYAGNQKPASDG